MTFLFISDMHLRSDIPVCRIDNFLKMQEETLKFLVHIAKEEEAGIIVAGDIFHRSKPIDSQYLENLFYDIFKGVSVYMIPGQHDLIGHNISNFDKGSIGVISRFTNFISLPNYCYPFFGKKAINLYGSAWNEKIQDVSESEIADFNICILHKFVSDTSLPPWLKNNGIVAKDLCEKYLNYNIFVCGDNHKSFYYKHPKTNQIVFNPGCITRQKLNEKEYRPTAYLYNAEKEDFSVVKLCDTNINVIRKSKRVEFQEQREKRIDSFIELAGSQKNITWDFENNLKEEYSKCGVSLAVKKKIDEWLEKSL